PEMSRSNGTGCVSVRGHVRVVLEDRMLPASLCPVLLFAGLQMGLWRSAAGPKHQGRNLKRQRRF
ncbi:hypothetical protein XENOCAPTIV_012605, partial [Xenoophorus captivus]